MPTNRTHSKLHVLVERHLDVGWDIVSWSFAEEMMLDQMVPITTRLKQKGGEPEVIPVRTGRLTNTRLIRSQNDRRRS